jgi:myo-inositol-1(or 4)-monophosphatase
MRRLGRRLMATRLALFSARTVPKETNSMHAMVNIALRAARDAASAVGHSSDRLDRVDIVTDADGVFTTSMDEAADKTLLYHLGKTYPDHRILSRVSGESGGDDPDTLWLIDPLLGSRNFVTGYSQYAVSLACQIKGKLEHAVVVDPVSRDEFTTSRGSGAQLNTRRIRVSAQNDLHKALIGLDIDGLSTDRAIAWQRELGNAHARIRVSGSPALDLLAVAAGRLQGGCCAGFELTSMAAAVLLLQESGGYIASETGSPDIKSASELIFGNQKIFRDLVKLRR